MKKEYKIIRNKKSSNFYYEDSDDVYEIYARKNKKYGTINYGNLYYQTIAYSKKEFSGYNYISHVAFINIKRVDGKLKFRFSIHSDFDGEGISCYEDCEVNIKNKIIKLRGFFATFSGMNQLKELLDFVLKNNKNLKIKATIEELKEFEKISNELKKEIEAENKIIKNFYQTLETEKLKTISRKDFRVKRSLTIFKNNLFLKPKFKNYEDLIDFLYLQEKKEKIKQNIFVLNELDFESELLKKLLNLNEINIISSNLEINISLERFKSERPFSETVCLEKEIKNKKLSIISFFESSVYKKRNEENKNKAMIVAKKIFEKISKILEK